MSEAKRNNSVGQSERAIGDILRSAHNLSVEQVQSILQYQQQKQVRFGEAAVALGILKQDEVIWALAQQFNYPYIASGAAGVAPELVSASEPFSPEAEFFRDIRSQLIGSVFSGSVPNTLAITSADVGDGKSYFAANLSIAFAQLGARTLLVDADMRTPVQHNLFQLDGDTVGLATMLSGRSERHGLRPCPSMGSLYILPVGITPPNPIELLERPLFGLLMKELASKFDYVILDTPAMSHGADGLIVSARSTATLTIVRPGETRKPDLDRMVSRIEKSPTHFAGVVVNDY